MTCFVSNAVEKVTNQCCLHATMGFQVICSTNSSCIACDVNCVKY